MIIYDFIWYEIIGDLVTYNFSHVFRMKCAIKYIKSNMKHIQVQFQDI